jgi:hypothetical protein
VDARGEQIVVRTQSGRRSFDQGSVCNQPLPLHRVEDFRVTAERAPCIKSGPIPVVTS